METGAGTAIVSVDSKEPPVTIYEFYKKQLPASGWALDSELNVGGSRILTGIKGNRKAVIHIESTEDGTRISFALSPAT
jgi:hypothetical protein